MSDILDRDELRREVALAGHAASEAKRELAAVTIERHDAAQRARIEDLKSLLAEAIKYAREDRMRTPGATRLARCLARAERALEPKPSAKSASCPHTLTLASGQVLHCIYVEGHDDIPHGYHREE